VSFNTPEYYTRQVTFESWTVAKFDGSDSPTAVYNVRRDAKGKLRCDCPRWLRKSTTACKHTAMVSDYINKGPQHGQDNTAASGFGAS
jgi:hypothetical protein